MPEQRNAVVAHPPGGNPGDDSVTQTYSRRELIMKRVLFYAGVLLWVVILMIPLSVMVLAMRGEFRFNLPGNAPNREMRIWMVMEKDNRGIAYSRPFVASRGDDVLAVQTDVRYLLWEGEGEAISYCQTYTREDANASWSMAESLEGAC